MNALKLLGVAVVCIFLHTQVALCQPNFTIGSASGDQNEVVTIDLRVSDFTDLIGIEFRLEWDANVAEFVSINNINSGLSGAIAATPPEIIEGRVTFSWFSANQPASIANNEIFYSVNLRLIGVPGSSSTVSFFDNPDRLVAIAASNPTQNIGVNFNSGMVSVIGEGGSSPTLTIGGQNVESGEEFCVGVSVNDFIDVTALQFDLGWDANIIEFTGIQNFNLSGLGTDDFNINGAPAGEILMAWISPNAGGINLDNNSSIFELCFTAVGASGTSTPIEFSNVITVPNFTTNDGQVNIQGGVSGFALIASDGTASPGQPQCTDISINGFNQIKAFQFSMNWDSMLFKYDTVININSTLAVAGVSIGNPTGEGIEEGQITTGWFSSTDVTLADGDILFTLCLNGPSDCGSTVPVTFTGVPTDILIAALVNGTTTPLPDNQITLVDGSVTVDCALNVRLDQLVQPDCNGEQTGAIFTTVIPTDGDYSFAWNGQSSTSEDLENIGAGTYTLKVTDNASQVMQSFEYVIVEPNAIVINGSSQNPSSAGGDGSITIDNVSGGTGTLTCLWNPDISDDCTGAANLGVGTFKLTVVDNNDCSFSRDFSLTGSGTTLTIASTPSDATCAVDGNCDGAIAVNIETGQGTFTMTIDGTIFESPATNLCPGDYEISVVDAGLNQTVTETVSVIGPDPLEFIVSNKSESEEGAMNGRLFVISISGGSGTYDIQWDGTSSDTLTNLSAGVYLLTITDSDGCQIQKMVEVQIGDPGDPRCFKGGAVITPNGDGKNDELVIRCSNLRDNEIRIFNRWGQLVHQQTNYDDTWDGTDLDGNLLFDGVYFWILSVELDDNTPREIKGYVNLIRNLN